MPGDDFENGAEVRDQFVLPPAEGTRSAERQVEDLRPFPFVIPIPFQLVIPIVFPFPFLLACAINFRLDPRGSR